MSALWRSQQQRFVAVTFRRCGFCFHMTTLAWSCYELKGMAPPPLCCFCCSPSPSRLTEPHAFRDTLQLATVALSCYLPVCVLPVILESDGLVVQLFLSRSDAIWKERARSRPTSRPFCSQRTCWLPRMFSSVSFPAAVFAFRSTFDNSSIKVAQTSVHTPTNTS